MKAILRKIGISEKTINEMVEICPEIKEIEKQELLEKIQILNNIGCDVIQARNIISSNPKYLTRMNNDIEKLLEKLKEYGFNLLNILFDGNPYILNLDAFEIEDCIKTRLEKGEVLEDIVDELSSNPYLFEN